MKLRKCFCSFALHVQRHPKKIVIIPWMFKKKKKGGYLQSDFCDIIIVVSKNSKYCRAFAGWGRKKVSNCCFLIFVILFFLILVILYFVKKKYKKSGFLIF